MKKPILLTLALILGIGIMAFRSFPSERLTEHEYKGAWKRIQVEGEAPLAQKSIEAVMLISDSYCSIAYYTEEGHKFKATEGGAFSLTRGGFKIDGEFSSRDTLYPGIEHLFNTRIRNKKLLSRGKRGGKEFSETWERIDDATETPMAGAWQIRERQNGDGAMVPMRPGPRKTVKMLTGTRFQWIAINTKTKKFFGTGGGNYHLKDGKYTEEIDFFSRDDSRVGASLSFDYKLDGDDWHHSGLSSRGKPIYEIWKRVN